MSAYKKTYENFDARSCKDPEHLISEFKQIGDSEILQHKCPRCGFPSTLFGKNFKTGEDKNAKFPR